MRKSGSSDELYDLAADLGEARALAETKPGMAKQLGASVEAWDKELVPPAFPGTGGRNAGKAQPKKPANP